MRAGQHLRSFVQRENAWRIPYLQHRCMACVVDPLRHWSAGRHPYDPPGARLRHWREHDSRWSYRVGAVHQAKPQIGVFPQFESNIAKAKSRSGTKLRPCLLLEQ